MGFVWWINTEGDLKDRIKSETKVQVYKIPVLPLSNQRVIPHSVKSRVITANSYCLTRELDQASDSVWSRWTTERWTISKEHPTGQHGLNTLHYNLPARSLPALPSKRWSKLLAPGAANCVLPLRRAAKQYHVSSHKFPVSQTQDTVPWILPETNKGFPLFTKQKHLETIIFIFLFKTRNALSLSYKKKYTSTYLYPS